jgi:hypothetical protein
MHVVKFIYLYHSVFIPIALPYKIISEFILNQIGDGFEKHSARGCETISFNISINEPKQNRPIGRSKHRQEDNIKMILKETVCDVNWIQLLSDNATSKVTEKLNMKSSSY